MMPSSSASSSHSVDKVDIAQRDALYRAIMIGNWEIAEVIFRSDEDALTAAIDNDGNTPLHLAVGTRNLNFVDNLLKMIIDPKILLNRVNSKGWTALHCAAVFGNIQATKKLVEKKPELLYKADGEGHLPIHKAIIHFHIKTFQYLRTASKCEKNLNLLIEGGDNYKNPFKGVEGADLLANAILVGELDIAYDLIKEFPGMAKEVKDHYISPLNSIASKCDAYLSGTTYNFYQRFLYSQIPIKNRVIGDADTQEVWRSYYYPAIKRIYAKFWELAGLHVSHIKKIRQEKEKHNVAVLLLECMCKEVSEIDKVYDADDIIKHYFDGFNRAVENDTPEAIEAIIRYFPQATWNESNGYNLSQNAIINRCEKVYDFLVEQVVNNHLLRICTDECGDNLLHLAGRLAPIHKLYKVSGAALQMQRELQWFEEVKKFVLPGDEDRKNNHGDTPMMIFREKHKDLRKEGEEWMRKTADSYTITAALIITIAFAAAITVPGGNNSDTGKAIFKTKASFIVFVVSDAISFFTSCTSLLMFLFVLTARYQEEDFLNSLPKRLILGLVMLFLSMTSMIVAFSATLYLLFGQGKTWILIPIGVLTCLPIASFVKVQFPLLAQLIQSTYGHGIVSRKSKRTLGWEY